MTIEIEGNWRVGRAYDVHTLASTYLGPDEFGYDRWDNTRSEMGELVYQLKYGQDRIKAIEIAKLLDKITGIETFDFIMPIPPTDQTRFFQPVNEIALALGERRKVAVLTDFLAKEPGGPQLKNVEDSDERERLLRTSLKIVGTYSIADKSILLIDDLFRSGATLRATTDLLLKQASVRDVCVLTMTKTRTKR